MSLTNQHLEELREHLKARYERELEVLLINATLNGLVITVEHVHPTPLQRPVMRGEVRYARGFYPKEKK